MKEFRCEYCQEILEREDGVNGSDYYECKNCKKSWNIIESEVEE